MLQCVFLGNIWDYPLALQAIPGCRVTAILYEDEIDAQGALRVSRRLGIDAYRVRSDEEVRQSLCRIPDADLGIIANFGTILSERTLQRARRGFVNFHPGLLPDQRGREPVRKVWERGGGGCGLTVHRVTAQVDAGPALWTLPYQVRSSAPLDDEIRAIFRAGLPFLSRVISSL